MEKKILIVDDEEQDRKAMAAVLEKEGYGNVVCTDTGKNAVEITKTSKPDVIVIDVVLQDIDGFDLCKLIRSLEGNKPKIIMITGHIDAVNAEKARASGADELILKVPGFGNIGQTINNITNKNPTLG